MNFNRACREDGDNYWNDRDEAARTRKFFRKTGYAGAGELGRQLLALEALSAPFGISEMDYDEDISDVDGSCW